MKWNILFFCIFLSQKAGAKGSFDMEMLRTLGYDSAISDVFTSGTGFLSGEHQINVIVNEHSPVKLTVAFDQHGTPCWQTDMLQQLGINPNVFVPSNAKDHCLAPDRSKNIVQIEHPDQNSIELKISPNWLLNNKNYASGGRALMLNYDASVYHYQLPSSRNITSQTLTSEAGINFNDWIARNGISYSARDGRYNFSSLYTYVQKTFTSISSVLQTGQISTNDPIFGGINMSGVQMFPEQALGNGGFRVSIDTSVSMPATIDVFQRNVLLKTFHVDAGPVSLDNIPVLSHQDNFVLQIRDDAGGRQEQTIPFIQTRTQNTPEKMGLSIALGRLRLSGDNLPVGTASKGIYQDLGVSLVAGGLVSQDYQAVGLRTDLRVTSQLLAILTQTMSIFAAPSQKSRRVNGIKHQVSLSYSLTGQLSASTAADFRSRDYVEPGSAWASQKSAKEAGQIKTQYSSGINYHHSWLGTLSASGTMTHNYRNADGIGYLLNWGKDFGRVNINLGIQKNRLTSDEKHYDDRYAYFNVSVPLGNNKNLRAWASRTNQKNRYGAGYDHYVNDKFAWSLSSEKNQHQPVSMAAAATWTNKYSKMNAGISRGNSDSYHAGTRGGLVLHDEGLTFTPNQIEDTFGIVSLGSNEPDVEIITPRGKVWTDKKGYAITSWTPWARNIIQVNNKSLPKNVQIQRGIAEITPYRGAVLPISLPAHHVRRALVSIPTGTLAPGSAIRNNNKELVAFVNEDSTIFFDDLPDGPLYGQTLAHQRCRITFLTPWQDDLQALYVNLNARCSL